MFYFERIWNSLPEDFKQRFTRDDLKVVLEAISSAWLHITEER